MGHAGYDRDTLRNSTYRDLTAGSDIRVPKNYFPAMTGRKPAVACGAPAPTRLLYSNWLNYFVYQTSPTISGILNGASRATTEPTAVPAASAAGTFFLSSQKKILLTLTQWQGIP